MGGFLGAASREMNGAVELSIVFVGLAFDGFWEVLDAAFIIIHPATTGDSSCKKR